MCVVSVGGSEPHCCNTAVDRPYMESVGSPPVYLGGKLTPSLPMYSTIIHTFPTKLVSSIVGKKEKKKVLMTFAERQRLIDHQLDAS